MDPQCNSESAAYELPQLGDNPSTHQQGTSPGSFAATAESAPLSFIFAGHARHAAAVGQRPRGIFCPTAGIPRFARHAGQDTVDGPGLHA